MAPYAIGATLALMWATDIQDSKKDLIEIKALKDNYYPPSNIFVSFVFETIFVYEQIKNGRISE